MPLPGAESPAYPDWMFSQGSSPVSADALAASLKPFGQSVMLPPEAYTSAEVFAWEQAHFFAGWQCVGRSGDIPVRGSQRAERVGDSTVLLARAKDGTLRGFANVCRHRAHELLPVGGTATARAITCPYHAWSYSTEGELIAAPSYQDDPDFDRGEYRLRAIRVQEWRGFVFADPSGQAPEFADWIGDLDAQLAEHRPEDLVVQVSHEYVVDANWKVISENYQECYHCPMIHPELSSVSPPDSGDNWDQPGAWVGGWQDIRTGLVTMSLDGHSDGLPIPGVTGERLHTVNYLALFPNLLISLHPDYVMTHRMVPLSAGQTWVECAWSFPAEAIAADGFDPAYAVDFWDLTNKQDWTACESVQRGLSSGQASPGPLSPEEEAVYMFVTMVARGYSGHPVHVKPHLTPAE
jgi:Rieske 2Fe-2S family protein